MKKSIRFITSSVLCICMMFCFSLSVQAVKKPAEDPQQVYQEFVDSISFIEDDPSWASFIDSYEWDTGKEMYSGEYADYVNHEGKTEEEAKEEYKNLTPFDRLMVTITYLEIAHYITHDHHYEDY